VNLLKNFFKEWIIPIIIAVVAALLIKQFLFFNILVPSESMYPTIKPNDTILVTRVYRPENLKRGDIVVFYSKELKESLIKRLIGISGDEVVIKDDGSVFVNGNRLNEPYVYQNGGISGTYKVPKDSYFFLGDNRGNSKDSRYWVNHYISKSDIKGKAVFILFPFKRAGVMH
jgi:signal peptidase I